MRTPDERTRNGLVFLRVYLPPTVRRLPLRMCGDGLYLFDEPLAALSPKRQMSALVRIHDLVTEHSQFIIATHSSILLAYPHSVIYECGDHGIRAVKYEDTDIFRSTRDCLVRHEKMLAMLLEVGEGESEEKDAQPAGKRKSGASRDSRSKRKGT